MHNMTKPSPSASARGAIRLGLLVYQGCLPAGLFAVSDLLHAVNRRAGRRVFETIWIAAGDERVHLPGGPVLELGHALEERCDAYLLPGFWAESAHEIDRMLEQQRELVAWLRKLAKQTRVWTYCMGVALLAAAGRTDRRQATATWWLEKPLRERFADVGWDFQQPVIEDGEVITAAGANGYWAVISKVLAAHLPQEVIRDVEQAMLVPRANTGHPVFRPVELIGQPEPQLQRLIAYAQKVPASELSLDAAAGYLAVSSRTLSRKIAQHTQVSAGEWLRLVKLRQVANALLSSSAPVKTICAQTGFADEASLMRAFKKATGLTTSQYRQQYSHSVTSFAGPVSR